MKITYEQYADKYFIFNDDKQVAALTFEELEAFGQAIHQLCQDEYNRALQEDLFGEGDCDGCKI